MYSAAGIKDNHGQCGVSATGHNRPSVIPLSEDSPLAAEERSLADAIQELELEVTPDQIAALNEYREELWAWNEKLNLTRHTTIEKFVTRDLFDTLQISQLLPEGERVLDVGSGGGVPGIPLAILRPDLEICLCESVNKKANVLYNMVEQLDLDVTVYAARLEAVVDKASDLPKFDSLIARGVAPLWKFMFWLRPHHQQWERLLLIKGPRWVDERGEARHRGLMKGYDLRRIGDYTTPGTEAVSTLLAITRRDVPPANPGKPRKR